MAYDGRKLSAGELADWIGGVQRLAFQTTGQVDRAVTIDEIRSVFELSRGTVTKLIREIRRRLGKDALLERNQTLTTGWGQERAGRPQKAYWLADGHRWDGMGKPLARMVVGAGGTAAMAGWSGVMDAQGVRAAVVAERRAIGADQARAWMSHSAAGVEKFLTAVDAPRWVSLRKGDYG